MKPTDDERPEALYGMHPVLEAIEAGKRTVDRVLVAREGGGRNLGRLLRAARAAGVPVTYLPREILGKKAGARAVHQGVVAFVTPIPYADPDVVCDAAAARPDGLLLAIDGVEDPRNLGAILRTAAAAGADGALLGIEDSVGLTPAVAKTAAGALERLPVARDGKLSRRVETLKARGFRAIALEPRGAVPWDREAYTGPLVILAGGEGRGLRRGLLDVADARVGLPVTGGIESLNVSVAVGVLLYEVLRQRRAGGKGGGS